MRLDLDAYAVCTYYIHLKRKVQVMLTLHFTESSTWAQSEKIKRVLTMVSSKCLLLASSYSAMPLQSQPTHMPA